MKKAFTLIELLMVIAIIAIISTLAVSKAGGVRERAALQLSIANQKAIERAVGAYLVGGGMLNRLDSLVYAQDQGAPLIGTTEGFDFDTQMTVENMEGIYLGPSVDDPTGKLRDEYNSGNSLHRSRPHHLSGVRTGTFEYRLLFRTERRV